MGVCLKIFLALLTVVGLSARGEVATTGGATSPAPASGRACSAEQVEENQRIINTCRENWSQWSTENWPPADLRSENECFRNNDEHAMALVRGCGRMMFSLPFMVLQLIAPGTPVSAFYSSEAEIFGRGSAETIVDYFGYQLAMEMCQKYATNSPEYTEWKKNIAETTGCRWSAGAFGHCNEDAAQRANEMFQAPRQCVQGEEFRQALERVRAEARPRAAEIIRQREIAQRLQSEREDEISRIRTRCLVERYSPSLDNPETLLNAVPLFPMAQFWREQFFPSAGSIETFNNCVREQIGDDPEFQKLLITSTIGFFEHILQSHNRYQCFNQQTRMELVCEVASAVVPGGAMAAGALAKLGRGVLRRGATRAVSGETAGALSELIANSPGAQRLFSTVREDFSEVIHRKLSSMSEADRNAFFAHLGTMNDDQVRRFAYSLNEAGRSGRLNRLNLSTAVSEAAGATDARSVATRAVTGSGETPPHPEFNMENLWRLRTEDPAAARALEERIARAMQNGEYTVIREMGDGVNGARLVDFGNGIRAIMKSDTVVEVAGPGMPMNINTYLERAAYIVDRDIGLGNVPPTVIRQGENRTTSFQFYVDGMRMGDGRATDLSMFDFLIGNTDRVKPGVVQDNLGAVNGRTVAFDNGFNLRSRHHDVITEVPELSDERLLRAQTRMEELSAEVTRLRAATVRAPGALSRAERNLAAARDRVTATRGTFLTDVRSVMWSRENYERFVAITPDQWRARLGSVLQHPSEMENFLHHRRLLIQRVTELRQRYGDTIFP